jgi:hypothetical protein
VPGEDFETATKLAIYRITAETGAPPSVGEVARRLGAPVSATREAFGRLRAQRLLLLEPDGETIRMAPPFSGVPTQHRVTVGGITYSANCAWDALGIPAALHQPGLVESQCAESGESLHLTVGLDGPEPSAWRFHCLVPAAHWWDDLVFT